MKSNFKYLLTYYGSKNLICDWILSYFPHDYTNLHYVEPFCGGLCVFLNKVPSPLESISDLNKDLFNLFLNVRDNYENLFHKIDNTIFNENDFNLAKKIIKDNNASSLDRAWATYIQYNFSFSGMGENMRYTASSRKNLQKSFVNTPKLFSKNKEMLEFIKNRLKNTQIFNRPAEWFIDTFRREKYTLMYLDPPYPHAKQGYKHKFSINDFNKMLVKLYDAKFKFLLSFYEKEDMHLQHFRIDPRFTFLYKNTRSTAGYYDTSKNNQKRTECLLINYKKYYKQLDL